MKNISSILKCNQRLTDNLLAVFLSVIHYLISINRSINRSICIDMLIDMYLLCLSFHYIFTILTICNAVVPSVMQPCMFITISML